VVGEDDLDQSTFQKIFSCESVEEYKKMAYDNVNSIEFNTDEK